MGKFLVKKTNTGFKFDLYAANGEVIASSEVYEREESCQKGVESVAKNAPIASFEDQTEDPITTAVNPKFEMYKDKAGEFRFRLKARNGEVIAASEGYKSKTSCLNGIESVKKNVIDAKVEKNY
ncbi:MAG: YegP family protein [Clostridiaceae bacterium]|nr:YegP family protein [Clostridiaceae bacterium]